MDKMDAVFRLYPEENAIPESSFLEKFAPVFLYGGTAFPAADFSCIQHEKQDGKEIFHLSCISGDKLLRYTLHLIRYKDFPVIEWLPELENIGETDTQLIEDFQSLSFHCPAPETSPIEIQRTCGSHGEQSDYLPGNTILHARQNQDLVMENTQGRSSSDWLPFFGVRIAGSCFLHFALGWSGAWKTVFHAEGETLTIRAGLRKTHFILHPGEKIRQSSFFIMEHNPGEDAEDAQNVFRHFMRTFHSPHNTKGELIKAPISFSCGGGTPEPMLMGIFDVLEKEKIPVELLWMDAGWFGGDHDVSECMWPDEERNIGDMGNQTLGNWFRCHGDWRINHTAHPHGLKVYADRAKKLGMGFMLWIEGEQALPGSPVAKEHPEWLSKTAKKHYSVNIGLPEVRQYLLNIIKDLVANEGVTMIRVDFNNNIYPVWEAADAPDRVGLSETQYVMGLYELWDEIRRLLPDAAIDNCASGGQRIDFETLSRSIPLWRVDGEHTPESQQIQVSELSRWVPQHASGLHGTTLYPGDDYTMLSLCATGTQIGYYPEQLADAAPWLRRICGEIDTIREGFLQNIYHLTDEVWNTQKLFAMQCDSLTHDKGLVILFRRNGSENVCTLPLRHIDPEATYSVTIRGKKETLKGEALKNRRFVIPQRRMVLILSYQKAKGGE